MQMNFSNYLAQWDANKTFSDIVRKKSPLFSSLITFAPMIYIMKIQNIKKFLTI